MAFPDEFHPAIPADLDQMAVRHEPVATNLFGGRREKKSRVRYVVFTLSHLELVL